MEEQGTSMLEVDGRIEVHVVRAKNLKRKDLLSKSDPYVVVSMQGHELAQTMPIKDNQDPEWNAFFGLHVKGHIPEDARILVRVMDHDGSLKGAIKKHDYLGTVSLPARTVFEEGDLVGVFNLLSENDSKVKGDLTLRFKYFKDVPAERTDTIIYLEEISWFSSSNLVDE
ncbi:Elicitor-responsive protein 3 [Porphyridium purpureum]|uniref:Elicitor-responsive protein 3 n=1 Tax=Porphyridium purpureum TaxID=35688 RepID=A0A5J4YQ68_PORPP|nr:Elicitor-responsive protein 3 [Porphyridium purpureum]|eukprot:POR2467..scf295_9